MQRYGVVLQELRLEVLRNNSYLASVSTPRAGGSAGDESRLGQPERAQSSQANETGIGQRTVDASLAVNTSGLGVRDNRDFDCRGGGTEPSGDMPATSTSTIDVADGDLAHMASWGQFDSLVS